MDSKKWFIRLMAVILVMLIFVEGSSIVKAASKLNSPVISISNSNNNPKISWKAIDGATGYRVYRKTPSDSEWQKVTTTTKTSVIDKKWSSSEGSTIKYRVKAYKKEKGKNVWSKASASKKWTVPNISNVSLGKKNALASAKSYLRFSAFSYEGLMSQLEYEGYTEEECTYAVDNCGANWNDQALASAKSYLQYSAFSYDGLIGQLEFEKFTHDQAVYGVDNSGADWFEQAAKCANDYIKYSSFSKSGLIDQLIFEGFTEEQAEYGVEAVGY